VEEEQRDQPEEEDSPLEEEQRAHAAACSLSIEDCGESISHSFEVCYCLYHDIVFNPRRMREGYGSRFVYVYLCICCQASCYIPRLRVQRPSTGVSETRNVFSTPLAVCHLVQQYL
jgi:hypothetical protein